MFRHDYLMRMLEEIMQAILRAFQLRAEDKVEDVRAFLFGPAGGRNHDDGVQTFPLGDRRTPVGQ